MRLLFARVRAAEPGRLGLQRRPDARDAMQMAVAAYNATPNSSGFAPDSVTQNNYGAYTARRMTMRAQALDRAWTKRPPRASFKVGARVRVLLGGVQLEGEGGRRGNFAKESWQLPTSHKIYTVTDLVASGPLTAYRISTADGREISGSYTASQLVSADDGESR